MTQPLRRPRAVGSHSTRVIRGQSLVEFAILLPILLAFLGASIDVARVFQAWITIEGATRDAAESAASFAADADDALTRSRSIICVQTSGLPGYVNGGTPDTCTQPVVSILEFSRSTTAVGASPDFPVATVRVATTLPFKTLFAYPFVTQDGAWTVGSTQSYAVVQNR